jgi:hypothetical protein
MRQPTKGNGPRGASRIIGSPAIFDVVVPPTADRGRPTSSAKGPRLPQQSDETNPMLVWERFVGRPVLEAWCRYHIICETNPMLIWINSVGWIGLWRTSIHQGKRRKQSQLCQNGSRSLGSLGRRCANEANPARMAGCPVGVPGQKRANEATVATILSVLWNPEVVLRFGADYVRSSPVTGDFPTETRAPAEPSSSRHPLPKMLNSLSKRRTPSLYWKRRPGPACIEQVRVGSAASLRGPGHDRSVPRQASTARPSRPTNIQATPIVCDGPAARLGDLVPDSQAAPDPG